MASIIDIQNTAIDNFKNLSLPTTPISDDRANFAITYRQILNQLAASALSSSNVSFFVNLPILEQLQLLGTYFPSQTAGVGSNATYMQNLPYRMWNTSYTSEVANLTKIGSVSVYSQKLAIAKCLLMAPWL